MQKKNNLIRQTTPGYTYFPRMPLHFLLRDISIFETSMKTTSNIHLLCKAKHGSYEVSRLPRKIPRCHRRPSGQSQFRTINTMPNTQIQGKCLQGPHLPRKAKMDVIRCHLCNAKSGRVGKKCIRSHKVMYI